MDYFFKIGALDFASGTVIDFSAGCAVLAGALVLKPRNPTWQERKCFCMYSLHFNWNRFTLVWLVWF